MSTSLLSVLVSLIMALTGGLTDGAPEALSARVLTLSDIVVTVDGEEYPLDLTGTLGAQTENGAALLDVSLTAGDDVLFPMQAKLDESGATVYLGDASKAYTFASGLFEVGDLGMTEALDAYGRMFSGMSELEQNQAAFSQAYIQALRAAAVPASAQTTIVVDGEELPATHSIYTLDGAALFAALDETRSAVPMAYLDALLDFYNSSMAFPGEEAAPVQSFAELWALAETELTLEVEETLTESGAGVAFVLVKLTADNYGETETIEIPVELILRSETDYDFFVDTELPEGVGTMELSGTVNEENFGMSMSLTIGGESYTDGDVIAETLPGAIHLNYAQQKTENGGMHTEYMVEFDVDGVNFALMTTSEADANGLGVTQIAAGFEMDGNQLGASFTATVSDAPIVDRIAGVPSELLSTEEEIENASGLMMSLMGLAADAEKLTGEPSVAAMVEAFNQLMPAVVDPEPVEITEAEIAAIEGDGELSDLPYDLPEFPGLPEGYECTEEYIYADSQSASLVYEYTGADDGEAHPAYYIDLYAYQEGQRSYRLTESGELEEIVGPMLTAFEYDDSVYATVVDYVDGAALSVAIYDGGTLDDIAALLAK